MQAAVIQDGTVRTIRIDVLGVPDIDLPTLRRKPRIFRPDHVVVTMSDGALSRVEVSGGMVLKSGAASTQVRDSETWFPDDGSAWNIPKMNEAPSWVTTLVSQAPLGISTWRTGDDAGRLPGWGG